MNQKYLAYIIKKIYIKRNWIGIDLFWIGIGIGIDKFDVELELELTKWNWVELELELELTKWNWPHVWPLILNLLITHMLKGYIIQQKQVYEYIIIYIYVITHIQNLQHLKYTAWVDVHYLRLRNLELVVFIRFYWMDYFNTMWRSWVISHPFVHLDVDHVGSLVGVWHLLDIDNGWSGCKIL